MKRMTQYLLAILIAASVPHFVAEGQKIPQGTSTITFEQVWNNWDVNVRALTYNKRGHILAGVISFDSGYGIRESRDNGTTWTEVGPSRGFHDDHVWNFTVDDSGYIYAAGRPNGLHRSTDDGDTWEMMNGSRPGLPNDVWGFALGIYKADNFFFATERGLYRSTNRGATWDTLIGGIPPNIDGEGPERQSTRSPIFIGDTAYVLVGPGSVEVPTNGVYRSTNGGNHWEWNSQGMVPGAPLMSLIKLPNGYLLASGLSYNNAPGTSPFSKENNIYQSTDYGATWQVVKSNAVVWNLVLGSDSTTIFACHGMNGESGLYYSTDNGSTWKLLGLAGESVQSVVMKDSVLYVGTWKGIYRGILPSKPTNHAPILSLSPGDTVTYGGTIFKRIFFAIDTDGDPVRVGLDSAMSPSWLTVDSSKSEVWGVIPYSMHGERFRFRLVATDVHGATDTATSQWYQVDRVVKVEETEIPKAFALSQNFPNPFNPTTTIEFAMPTRGRIRLSVTNILGIEVSILAEDVFESGAHRVTWDASGLPSGTYFYRLEANGFIQTKKMVLIR